MELSRLLLLGVVLLVALLLAWLLFSGARRAETRPEIPCTVLSISCRNLPRLSKTNGVLSRENLNADPGAPGFALLMVLACTMLALFIFSLFYL
ncbi:hypothetical protein [Chitinilyticum litopenaei]|uniref:hypothetical protein n=1 Tax=Chitinilyticum litopenaei TaxID=1121276 RepID=UPI0004281BA5|nr:hypothetical protein [Chitinilyticum litopenaei]